MKALVRKLYIKDLHRLTMESDGDFFVPWWFQHIEFIKFFTYTYVVCGAEIYSIQCGLSAGKLFLFYFKCSFRFYVILKVGPA